MSSSEGSPKIAPVGDAPRAGVCIPELPYVVVLMLTILGVAYTSYVKQLIAGYWELLAPLIGLTCVGEGWQCVGNSEARFRLIWMQVLHWLAFLIVMNLLFLPNVQQIHRRCPS